MKQKIKTLLSRIDAYRLNNFGKTTKAVYIITMLILATAEGVSYMDIGMPRALSFIIVFVITLIASNIALALAFAAVKLLLRNGIVYILCFAALCAGMTLLIDAGSFGSINYIVSICIAVVIVWLLMSFCRSVWAVLFNKVRTKTILVSLILSGLFTSAVLVFMFTSGFENRYINNYLALKEEKTSPEGFKAELKDGSYTPAFLYYGDTEKSELKSDSINLGDYVGGYTGLQKTYRKLYQGYDIYSVPLVGKVWYPEETDNCPVLFIAHGNHNLTTDSYEGYDYLGKYLASHGYVVVSLDSNSCNGSVFGGLSGDNDGRAVLILKTIKQILKYNMNSENPLYGKIDENNIAVSGHSRGGEAAALAALFNELTKYPSNGRNSFFWDLNIKSIIAIAPCVNQYMPADHEVELRDINYLLIQGSNDQDVTSNMGARQYENISFSGEGKFLKSALYIAGANHGQFNTTWGRYDMQAPLNLFMNTAELISQENQQAILKVFIKVFLDTTLKGGSKYEGLLRDCTDYSKALPDTLYTQVYMNSDLDVLCDFERETDLTVEDSGRVKVDTFGTSGWTEELATYSNPSTGGGDKGSYVLSLNWIKGKGAKLELEFNDLDCSGKKLYFDIADTDIEGVKKGDKDVIEAEIELLDSDGNKASVLLSEYALVYQPLPVNLGKLQSVLNKPEYKILYSTVGIPVEDFGDEIDINKITGLTINFKGTSDGSVNLDNIGFSVE